jgi:hypothetical protein
MLLARTRTTDGTVEYVSPSEVDGFGRRQQIVGQV